MTAVNFPMNIACVPKDNHMHVALCGKFIPHKMD